MAKTNDQMRIKTVAISQKQYYSYIRCAEESTYQTENEVIFGHVSGGCATSKI